LGGFPGGTTRGVKNGAQLVGFAQQQFDFAVGDQLIVHSEFNPKR
jgi:hypothetical protein